MPRYIDEAKLVQAIVRERDKIPLTVPCAPYELLDERANAYGQAQRSGIRKALRCVAETPTADVAPKSEVENLKVLLEITQKAHDDLRELYRTDTDALVEARRKTETEVAREIFAEIDKIIIGCRVDEYSKEFGYVVRQNYNGASIVRCLAELKKKYDVTDTNVGSKYFTPEQVRAMSREEVHKNYSAIMESMKTWGGERK